MCALVSRRNRSVCQPSAELLLLVTRQGWTLSRGKEHRWSDNISNKYDKRKDKPQALPSRSETLGFYGALSNGTAASCEDEKVFASPGGVWRDGWYKTFRTGGALDFCLAVIKGGE